MPIFPSFDNESVGKGDILFLFTRSYYDVFDKNELKPVEESLVVNMCKYVDSYYIYMPHKKIEEDDSDDDSDSVGNFIEIDESILDNSDTEC